MQSHSTLFFNNQNSSDVPRTHDEMIKLLIGRYNKIIVLNKEFQKRLQFAYSNQLPPEEKTSTGRCFHIQSQDYQACQRVRLKLGKSIKEAGETLFFYYNLLSCYEDKQKLKRNFESYSREIISISQSAENSFDNHYTGLTFFYHYPNPNDRRHYEWCHEHDMTMRIYGFS